MSPLKSDCRTGKWYSQIMTSDWENGDTVFRSKIFLIHLTPPPHPFGKENERKRNKESYCSYHTGWYLNLRIKGCSRGDVLDHWVLFKSPNLKTRCKQDKIVREISQIKYTYYCSAESWLDKLLKPYVIEIKHYFFTPCYHLISLLSSLAHHLLFNHQHFHHQHIPC